MVEWTSATRCTERHGRRHAARRLQQRLGLLRRHRRRDGRRVVCAMVHGDRRSADDHAAMPADV